MSLFKRIDEKFFIGAQPTEQDLHEAKQQGVKTGKQSGKQSGSGPN